MENFKTQLKEKAKNLILDKFEVLVKNLIDGIKYISCIGLVILIFRLLLEYPLKLAVKYNIKIFGAEFIELMKEYGTVVVWIILISVLSRPAIKLANRLKTISKDKLEFDKDYQSTETSVAKTNVQEKAIDEIIKSDDSIVFDEISEENLYNGVAETKDKAYNFLKCKEIKRNMKPLTALITMELYNNSKENVTKEIVYEYICNVKNRRRKKMKEQNKNIAKNIVEFLNNNDIIESDDMEIGKYYFTPFGCSFMNYFQNGII